jgi:hypothetical protein
MGVIQTISERMKSNMLKWYGHVVCMEGHRWPKVIMTWSPEGRRPEEKWEKEVERVAKRTLTRDSAVNRQV